jgi:hypothetical protein
VVLEKVALNESIQTLIEKNKQAAEENISLQGNYSDLVENYNSEVAENERVKYNILQITIVAEDYKKKFECAQKTTIEAKKLNVS